MNKLSQKLVAFFIPDFKHIVGLIMLFVATFCWVIGFSTSYVSHESSVLLTIASFIYVAYFFWGLIFYMSPFDVVFSTFFIVLTDVFVKSVIGFIQSSLLILILTMLMYLLVVIFVGLASVMSIIEFLPIIIPIFLGILLFNIITSLSTVLRVSAPVILVLLLALIIIGYLVSHGMEGRRFYEIPFTFIMIAVFAWPILTASGNLQGMFENRLGQQLSIYSSGKTFHNEDLTDMYFDNYTNLYSKDLYESMINDHTNANLASSLHTGVCTGANENYYAAIQGKNILGLINDRTSLSHIYKGTLDDEATVLQYKDFTFILTDKDIYVTKYAGDNSWGYNIVEKGWKDPLRNASDVEIRKTIMQDLLNQYTEDDTQRIKFDSMARIAYAQARGILLDFDEEQKIGYFADRQGTKLSFISMNSDMNEINKGEVTAQFDGMGAGYFLYQDNIYYINGKQLCSFDLRRGINQVEYEMSKGEFFYLNYFLIDGSLRKILIDETNTICIFAGNQCVTRINTEFEMDVFDAAVYYDGGILYTYNGKPASIGDKCMAYLKNQPIPHEAIEVKYMNNLK